MRLFKCFKKIWRQKCLMKLMKSENIEVRKACEKKDWGEVAKWLHLNKSSFKSFRRIQKL